MNAWGNNWCDHTSKAVWWQSGAAGTANVIPIQASYVIPPPREDTALDWLDRQVAEVIEAAA